MHKFPQRPQDLTVRYDGMNQVFRHKYFLDADKDVQREIMLKSAEEKYAMEKFYPWDAFFRANIREQLRGKHMLDLGSFTGGRGMFWYDHYGLDRLTGLDINPIYIEAATLFANKRKSNAEFVHAFGEAMPFEDNTFDAICSYDVFEHVQDLDATLAECYRILKPGGRLYAVFPSLWQPFEHHLGLVTDMPFIQFLFKPEVLIAAYYDVIAERGDDENYWYQRDTRELESWEKGNTLNGTTAAQMRKYISHSDWRMVEYSRKPFGLIGPNVTKKPIYKAIAAALYPLTFLPFLEDVLLHRLTYILEKPQKG